MKITDEIILAHRSIIPLPFEEITFYSSFIQLVGAKPEDYSPEDRYKRFSRNLELMNEAGEHELFEYWSKASSEETCVGCIHRYIQRNWCTSVELPCNYNPIIRGLGMACGGVGFESGAQMDIDF